MRRLRFAVAAAMAAVTSFLLFAGAAAAATPNILNGASAVGSNIGMVAVVLYNDGPDSFLCSGTVVASDVILTAGHCAENEAGIVDSPSGYEVLTGTQSLATPGQTSGVTQVIPYPNFNPETVSGDAALLVLSTPTTVTPVTLATDPGDAYLYNAGVGTTIAGWGIDDSYGDLPDELLYGSSVVQTANYCAGQASNASMLFSAAYQMCAVDAPSDFDGTCNGDSGGPIMVGVGGTWVEIGITSFGASNCSTARPGFFTRTDSIASWIQNEIRANAPAAATPPTATPVAPAPVAATPATPAPASLISYVGRTSQRNYISLKLAGTRTTINGFSFGFTLRCTRHRPLVYTYTEPTADNTTWPLSNGAFDRSFTDNTGERYQLTGTITTASASGTLSTTWRSRKYGKCASGNVRWRASPAQ